MQEARPELQDSPSRRIAARLASELRQFVVMFLYLWILLGLFVLNQYLSLEQRGITVVLSGFALLNALILAKVMMVAEYFDLTHWLRNRPLIYPVVYESLLLAILFIVFHFVEREVIGLLGGKSLRESLPMMGGGGLLGVVCVACILFFSLIPFFAFKHLSRVLGANRVVALFLRDPRSFGE